MFISCCDKTVRLWDLASNQEQTVAMHDEPITLCKWIKELNYLVTASWDGKVKYWDCQKQQPVLEVSIVNMNQQNQNQYTTG